MTGLQGRLHASFKNLLEDIFLDPAVSRIEQALLIIASSPDVVALSGSMADAAERYRKAQDDPQEREEALLELYLAVHRAGWEYSASEEQRLSACVGNPNIPGGLAPLVLAEPFIEPDTVVADLGAGNGLQGLLMQYMWPYARTVLVEISSGMLETGRVFQRALGIPDDRVQWRHGDIRDIEFEGIDVVYLYRPARPYKEGNELYRTIARKLQAASAPLTVLSVADCLGRFLGEGFSSLLQNDYISVFRKGDV